MKHSFEYLQWGLAVVFMIAAIILILGQNVGDSGRTKLADLGREEVVFWHFWGGTDRDVVDDVVRRFNESQQDYWVRSIAMPGNNLNSKLFLAIAGGDPPDIVNQDDPIIADWSARRAIIGIDEIATTSETESIKAWLLESALRLASYDDRLMAVPNGLDIRAIYYNKTMLDRFGLKAPRSIDELDNIARSISPPGTNERNMYAFIPDSRRLWSWAYVFGGQFVDQDNQPTLNQPENIAALKWMAKFSRWYGPDQIAAYRQGDQSLPGKTFPLLPIDDASLHGRYVLIQDGQWRTRDIRAFLEMRRVKKLPAPEFGVCPLPPPPDGRKNGGWVNGNFFVVPRGARNPNGALAFAKFWIGFDNPSGAAQTCAAGGWIPVSRHVIEDPAFQHYLENNLLFKTFVDLAGSENQFPYPQVPGAPYFKRTVDSTVQKLLSTNNDRAVSSEMENANDLIRAHLQNIEREFDGK